MKNFVQPGNTLTLVAPYTVVSGAGLLVGNIFGVASADAASGADVEAVTEGVFDLAKVSAQAWAQGDPIYWDDSAKLCTTTAGANTPIGHATAIAARVSERSWGITRTSASTGMKLTSPCQRGTTCRCR